MTATARITRLREIMQAHPPRDPGPHPGQTARRERERRERELLGVSRPSRCETPEQTMERLTHGGGTRSEAYLLAAAGSRRYLEAPKENAT